MIDGVLRGCCGGRVGYFCLWGVIGDWRGVLCCKCGGVDCWGMMCDGVWVLLDVGAVVYMYFGYVWPLVGFASLVWMGTITKVMSAVSFFCAGLMGSLGSRRLHGGRSSNSLYVCGCLIGVRGGRRVAPPSRVLQDVLL